VGEGVGDGERAGTDQTFVGQGRHRCLCAGMPRAGAGAVALPRCGYRVRTGRIRPSAEGGEGSGRVRAPAPKAPARERARPVRRRGPRRSPAVVHRRGSSLGLRRRPLV
jgi:hypothetical protein